MSKVNKNADYEKAESVDIAGTCGIEKNMLLLKIRTSFYTIIY